MWLLLLAAGAVAAANDTCGFSRAYNADVGGCHNPYIYCGEWGTPDISPAWNASAATNPYNASFVCVCTHARTGAACDTCDAVAFCDSADATCASDPHDTRWCVCGDTSGEPNWRPWWRAADPLAPCNACQQGWISDPLDSAACVTLGSECTGPGVDSTLSQVLGICTCARGWKRSVIGVDHCDACIDGFSMHGGECMDCEDMCGGTAYDACIAPSTPGSYDCTCLPGVAGPPCVAGQCLDGYLWDGEACVQCPLGCGGVGSNGTCVFSSGVPVCDCAAGWTGANCTACSDDTVSIDGMCAVCPPCSGGECQAVEGVATCVCPPLWAGDAECTTCTPDIAVPSADFRQCVGCDPVCSGNAVCTLTGSASAECVCPDDWVSDGNGGCSSCGADDTTGPVHGCVACPTCTAGRRCMGVADGEDGWDAVCSCGANHTWWGEAQCVAPVSWPAASGLVDVEGDPVYGSSAPGIYSYVPDMSQRVDLFVADVYMAAGVLFLLAAAVTLATWLT